MNETAILTSIFLAATASAEGWYEPKRGSDERSALMDAIRPHVEWQLGQPIQFVVGDLRVSGDVAFGVLNPQRPGGAEARKLNCIKHLVFSVVK